MSFTFWTLYKKRFNIRHKLVHLFHFYVSLLKIPDMFLYSTFVHNNLIPRLVILWGVPFQLQFLLTKIFTLKKVIEKVNESQKVALCKSLKRTEWRWAWAIYKYKPNNCVISFCQLVYIWTAKWIQDTKISFKMFMRRDRWLYKINYICKFYIWSKKLKIG